ncbi:hypothetical protein VTI74DRAFT_814 [Chaetomium olivicolor]
MTSTASQPNQNPATTPSAPAAPSYASAAGANKKPTSSPLIATGSQPPVVVGSSAQNGKPSTVSPMNGRPNITPAVPVAAPPVARGSSIVNGGPEHSRNSSVTISANAPASHMANGGPAGGPKNIQFGFESPAVAHSTPQMGGAAPIPIPGGGNPRIQSPAHSPSPIPQIPQQSGGQRAPSSIQAPPTFGSFPGDNDRHMKQHMGTSPHVRRDSQASTHGDSAAHGGPVHGRGGYQGQGRGRGNFNPQYNNNNNMGFPPNRNFSNPSAGRGGMPTYHQGGRGGMQQFPNSPQAPRASPATTPAMPHGTPTMQPAPLATGPAQAYFHPGMNPAMAPFAHHQMQMGNHHFGMPPPIDYRMGYAPYPGQPMNAFMQQPPQFAPAAPQAFVPPYGPGQPAAPPMSRNASQVSDRPASSSTGQNQVPAIAQGTPQQRPAQPAAPTIVSSQNFARPAKRSAAIVIKDSEGKVLDLHAIKAPTSPAPAIQQSKTPPAIVSTPTPPPKSSTPSHGRTDSGVQKTAEQVRNEFKESVLRKHADAPSDAKPKEDEAAKSAAAEKEAAEKEAAEKKAAEEKEAAEKEAAEKAAAEKAAEEKAAAEAKAAEEKAAAEKAAAEKAAAEEKAKEEARIEAEKKAAEEAKAKEEKKSAAPDEMSEEELERMIREMEEEDARREKEQAEISARKKAQMEEEKKRAEAEKLSGAELDKKLREQEREMERLEEERERKRQEKEAKGGQTVSVADLLSKKFDELKVSDKEEKPTAEATTATKPGAADKAKSKPAALNLAPLKTTPVEASQPSAALQSLRSARFLPGVEYDIYPAGIQSPNPALNAAVQKKGKIFKYDAQFLLQFQNVFTEQPSPEFHQQVKALIGDPDGGRSASARTPGGSGRQGSRAGGSSAMPAGGPFGQFGAKTLPPGTTSEQRFAMSQGNMARPGVGLGSFGRGGAFPGQLSRAPSSGAAGLASPRTGSRRGGSRKDFGGNAKAEAQAAKTMPLTHGQEVKPITISATGWKPTSIGNKAAQAPTAVLGQGGHLDPEMVQRKVKAALNKMTPENFDRISEQILTIAAQSKNEQDGRTLRQVIQLTFEKATDEAHWASMYAKFCKRMLETMSPEIRDENILDKQGNVVSGGALFRKYLLNRCQEEFERGWKVDLPEAATEAQLMSEEYYAAAAAKRRGLGLVQFIGELYKLGMLTERIMHECVRKLLEFTGVPDESEIESLTKLLRTIGANLDSQEKGRQMMQAYFARIETIIEIPKLPSRLKFMLMDVVDLRQAGWVSKEQNKGPKTLEEIRAEAEAAAAAKAAESARSSQRGAPGGRPMGGRGESRNFQYNAASNQVGIDDLRRLKGSSSRTSSQNPSFGPTSMFNSRSNSGRRMGGPGGAFGRAGEDSGASSRSGTPTTRDRDSVAHANAFGLLADTGDHPGSPPSAHASPALSKATLDTVAAGEDKKEE